MLEWLAFIVIVVPGLLYALRGSSYLVDYTILVFVFNREIRRVIDYMNHHFNPFSPISLTPLFMLGLLFIGFLWNMKALHSLAKQIFFLFIAAIGYGVAIGFLRNGPATFYQAGEYLSAIGMMGYVAANPADDKTADRWLRTAAWAGIIAALYGWYQYLTIPEWDAFWVEQVGFVGYLGQLVPTQLHVFSTFAERGPCASYMALVSIPILASKRWRPLLGLPEVLLLLSCIFLTYSRGGIIVMVLGIALFPIVNGGKNLGRVVTIGAVVLALSFAGITALPGADHLVNRFRSLGAMQDDSSFQGRIMIAQGGWGKVLENPAGYGVGSSGLSGRINTGSQFNDQSVISDNGWLTLMTALGLPGFLLFAMALVTMWRYFSSLTRVGVTDDYLGLAKAFFVATVILMWEGNFFTELSVMWIAMGRALSPLMLYKIRPEYRPIAQPEYSRALRT
jgi:putative inorganic carbon (hco3(-)) transporter